MNDRFLFKAYIKAQYKKEDGSNSEVGLMFYDFTIENGGEQISFSDSELLRAIDDTTLSDQEKESVTSWFEANYSTETTDVYWGDVDVLIQCTGMKDKNGQLIYEGDIVEYKISTGVKPRGVVEYSNVGGDYHKGGQALGTYQKSTAIIGNIYENPEVL